MRNAIVEFCSVCLLAGGGLAPAQSAISFEVASVKPASPDARGGGYKFGPGGRTVINNFTLKNLIMVAWHLQSFEVVGGPAWIDSDRYDVDARAADQTSETEAREMLRSLLKDRFHLELRAETRELSIFSLVPAKPDGKLGSGLTQTGAGVCTPVEDFNAPSVRSDSALPSCGVSQRFKRQENGGVLVQLAGTGATLDALARALGTELGRHVENETHIDGLFTFTLEYTPERRLNGQKENPPTDTAGPSLVTALQEQLGLKLQSRKGPVQVWVAASAQKPGEN